MQQRSYCWVARGSLSLLSLCAYSPPQTFREPASDYQVVREKAASQRRDVERALTRFMAKTGETQSLFKDDITAFPCEPLSALLSFFVIPASPQSPARVHFLSPAPARYGRTPTCD